MSTGATDQDFLIEAVRSSILDRATLSTSSVHTVNFSKEFLIVRLDCGPIGISINYECFGDGSASLPKLQIEWDEWLAEQTRDWGQAWQKALTLPTLLCNGVQVALLSVLSQLSIIHGSERQPTYLKGPKSIYDVHHNLSQKTLGYIGMGDKLEVALGRGGYDEVHISDFNIHHGPLEKYLSSLHSKFPDINFVFTDGSRNEELIRECDLICVTASSILNGTLLPILEKAKQEKTDVCLFGISGNMSPDVFFSYGVKAIGTIEVSPSCWQSVSRWLGLDSAKGIDSFDKMIPFCEVKYVPAKLAAI